MTHSDSKKEAEGGRGRGERGREVAREEGREGVVAGSQDKTPLHLLVRQPSLSLADAHILSSSVSVSVCACVCVSVCVCVCVPL